MIDLRLSFQPSPDGKNLVVSDQTVWPSDGVARDAVRLHLFAVRVLGETNQHEIFLGNTDSVNVVSWTLENSKDGYYKVLALAVPAHNPLTGYVKNDLVSSDEKVYKAVKTLVSGTSITADNCWIEVTNIDEAMALTSFPNSSYFIAHYLRDDDTNKCVGEKAMAYAKKACGCADLCSQIEDYHWTTIYHAAAIYSFGFGDYSEAGKLLGAALDRCGTTESSPCNCH